MSNLDVAVACALLAATALLFIFNVHWDLSDSAPHRTKLDQLLERRDAIYDNLRDLRFEYRAGKYSEKDYEEIKQSLDIEAAQVLASMDRLTGSAPHSGYAPGGGKAPKFVKFNILVRKFLQLSVLSGLGVLLAVSAAEAGTVNGTVHNGTVGKPASGVTVILLQLQGGMQPVGETKTDSAGHFRFDNPSLGTAPMLLRAVYRGVNYHEPVMPGKLSVDMEVFEPTDKASAVAVTAHAIIVQPMGSDLQVGEIYNIQNKTQPPVAYYRADGSFLFTLPSGAQISDVSAVGSSGMPVVQGTIDKGNNKEAIAYPFRPGESGVRLTYKVPYPGNQTKLNIVSPYASGRVAVFAPPSVQISGNGLSPGGQEEGFNVYMRDSLAANAPISIVVSGTAPVPSQNEGDNSQNPSVNSRADSGGEAPAAVATTLPARIDSIKWVLASGFAAIFALGLIYLWRRPQEVAVDSGNSSAAALQGPGSSSSKTDLDRAVRGSLEELKDALLRLELRRQAGTVSEEEYAREHERMQGVLRGLVKG